MPNSPSGNSLRRSPRGKLQQRYESSLAKKKKAPGRKKSVPKRKSAKTKSKVNTAAAKKTKKSGAGKRSRNSESADGKTHERKQTSERTAGSTKGSRTKSVAARQHRDVDEHNSIENSCSSNSSEEEASVHSTDDNSDMVGSTDSVDREGAAWEEGSDIGECNTGNDKAQSLFSRTSFNDALEREKDNSEEGESFHIKTAGRATSQLHNEDATSRTAGERRPPIPTTVMESSTNGNNPLLRQHGGRLEGLAMDLDEVKAGLRGLTRKESMEKRQPHMAERVRHYVKSFIFRRIKFVNSDQMSQKALHLVMDHENVPTRNRETFYMLYDSVFNEALNTKRSSCEQAAGRIVRDSIAKLENPDDFFTFEELCKLRRATTERERNAFFWFFGTFMDSVCGRRTWGKQKYKQLLSTACETGGQSKLVTRSDEAFGLLLFENYIDKWKMTTTVAARAPGNNGTGQCESNKNKSKLRGKYTGKKSGHCKYGGWCHEGTTRFNELYAMVGEDRVSAQAAEMEKELLRYCHAQEYGNAGNDGDTAHEDGGQTNASSTMLDNVQQPVEACWDEV